MITLALDTSTNVGSVAIGDGAEVYAEAVIGVRARHSEALLPAIDFVLCNAGLQRSQIGRVVVAGGPGSFTGLRIAGATAKGLVRALGCELFSYSGLLALAAGYGGSEPVCALFDARREEVYATVVSFENQSVEAQPLAIVEHLQPIAAPLGRVLDIAVPLGAVFIGEGALRYREQIAARGGRIGATHFAVPHAATLLWLAGQFPEQGRVSSVAGWEPAYMRESGAERMRA